MKHLLIIVFMLSLINSGCRVRKEPAVSISLIESYSFLELAGSIDSANTLLAARQSDVATESGNSEYATYGKTNPIYGILRPNIKMQSDGRYYAGETSDIGYISAEDTAQLLTYFRDSEVSALLPPDMELFFIPNVMDKLTAYAVRKEVSIQQLNPDQVKHYEFRRTGLTGILGININNEASLFFIHLGDDLISKLPADKTYTLLMNIDSATYAGSYVKTSPPSSVNMNSISKADKDLIERMFKNKVIEF